MSRIRPVLRTAGTCVLALSCLVSLAVTWVVGRWLVLAPQGAADVLSRRHLPPKPVHAIPFAAEINRAAGRHGLDPSLVAAVVAAESDFRPAAVSRRGARGLMQLLPDAWREAAPPDCRAYTCVFRPEANLDAGSRYLRKMLDRFGGDVRLALAAYNAGPAAVTAVRGVPPYRETHGYVLRVGVAWWELRRSGTLRPVARVLLRSLDGVPLLAAASGMVACALGAATVWWASRSA